MNVMRILSLNAWGGKLHSPLMNYLSQVDADVLCLQEIARSPTTEAEWLTYRDADVVLPQRANLFDEIAAALPGHDGFFCPTARGTLFDGDRSVASEFGLATFVRRTHSVIGQALGFVHGSFSSGGWGPHPRARNAHCIRLFDHDIGAAITIAQMHGLREIDGKNDTAARHAQADALVALIRQVSGRRAARRVRRLQRASRQRYLPGTRAAWAYRPCGLPRPHGHSNVALSEKRPLCRLHAREW